METSVFDCARVAASNIGLWLCVHARRDEEPSYANQFDRGMPLDLGQAALLAPLRGLNKKY